MTRSVPRVSGGESQHLPGDLLPRGGAREAAEAGAPPRPGVVTKVRIIPQLVLLSREELKVLAVRTEAVLPGDGVRLEQRLAGSQARVGAASGRRNRFPISGRGPGDGPQRPRGFSVGRGAHGRGKICVGV